MLVQLCSLAWGPSQPHANPRIASPRIVNHIGQHDFHVFDQIQLILLAPDVRIPFIQHVKWNNASLHSEISSHIAAQTVGVLAMHAKECPGPCHFSSKC